MARGRMIDRRISKSKKFAALKSDRSRVLYFMIYPHLDCEGRITGDPEEIKEDCCPKLKYSIRKIAESIIDLANVGLLDLYENEEESPFIEFTKFEPFQIGMRKEREAPSSIPSPQDVRTNSGLTPALYLRLSLSLRKEGKKEEVYFDFKERKFFNIKDKDIEGWEEAYPACDITAELKKMREWLLANPEKRNIVDSLLIGLSEHRKREGLGRSLNPPRSVNPQKKLHPNRINIIRPGKRKKRKSRQNTKRRYPIFAKLETKRNGIFYRRRWLKKSGNGR